jgi:hypothetical protein
MSRIKMIDKPFKLSSKTGIKAANAIDMGISNMVGNAIFHQESIEMKEGDSFFIKERLTQPLIASAFMTTAGLPRVFGLGGLSTLQGSAKVPLALESAFAFSSGVGASLLGAGLAELKDLSI